MTEIITTLITGVLALIGAAIPGITAARRTDVKICSSMAATDAKLEDLTREVQKHNRFAERVPALEAQMQATDRRLTNLENKIN